MGYIASLLLTCFSGVEVGTGVPGGTAGRSGSSTGPLAITSFTLFPHCLRTCATCSLLIPARSVSPIFKMWSPLHNLPCWRKNNEEKVTFLPCTIQLEKKHIALVTSKTYESCDFFWMPSQYPDNMEKKRRFPNSTWILLGISPEISWRSFIKTPPKHRKKKKSVYSYSYWYITTACRLQNSGFHFQEHFQKTAFSFLLILKK